MKYVVLVRAMAHPVDPLDLDYSTFPPICHEGRTYRLVSQDTICDAAIMLVRNRYEITEDIGKNYGFATIKSMIANGWSKLDGETWQPFRHAEMRALLRHHFGSDIEALPADISSCFKGSETPFVI